MKNKLISVIIPVYNIEEYLDRCIQSVVNQTYKNLEIILVDDGSPDNCPKICDSWAKKDERIKVIHKQNGGLSDARNAAIDIANGEYVSFVDSDDFIHETMLEKLLRSILENNSDIAKCMITHVDENNNYQDFVEVNSNKINSENIFYFYTLDDGYKDGNKTYTQYVSNSVCSSLYSKKIIDNKRFVKGMFSEDLMFNCDVITPQTKISVVYEHLYYYFFRSGSIMHTYNENKIIKRLAYIDAALERLSKKLKENEFKAYKFQLYKQLVLDILFLKDKKIYKKYKSQINSKKLNTKENYKEYKKNYRSFKRKVLNFLVHNNMFFVLKVLYKLKGQ